MEKRIGYRSMGKLAAAAAVGLAGFTVSQKADASVIIDVRATTVNGVPVADAKSVTAGPGDVVAFNIFANVSGSNGVDDEGFQAINGAVKSGAGGLLGDITVGLVSPFNGTGSSAGTRIDIDSDGDLDVSGPNPNLAGGYFNPRDAAGFATDGTRVGEGEAFLIGTASFLVAPGGTGSTVVDYLQHRTATGANNLAWGTFLIDGNNGGTTPSNATNTPITTTGGVTVSSVVPEPASMAGLGLVSLGLLARRRNKKNA
jgi:hypothetical protein